MSEYEIIQNIIRVAPWLILLFLFILVRHIQWYWRFSIVTAFGWLVVASSTLLYWWYAIEHAPSEEVRHVLALKDGAPRFFGVFFGWIYAVVLWGVFEGIRALVYSIRRGYKQS